MQGQGSTKSACTLPCCRLHTIHYKDEEVLSHDLSKVLHELLPPATQPVEGAPRKRSRGGAPATPAAPAPGAAQPSGSAKGAKRQKQQQDGPAQAAGGKQAGEEAAAAVQPASPTAPLGGAGQLGRRVCGPGGLPITAGWVVSEACNRAGRAAWMKGPADPCHDDPIQRCMLLPQTFG